MTHDAQRRWEETAAAVAHELGTPLTVAQAAIQALAPTADDEQSTVLIDAALRSLRSMELQIARLRRLEGASPDEPERRHVDLVTLARELIDDLDASLLHDHPTSLDGPDELIVTADPDQLRQVLYNLLSNAAKYSPPGRDIVVAICTSGDDAVLRVRDRGHGVAPEDAERIFAKYERGDQGLPGAGLGLYLARLVVEAHGGRLELVPAEGEGAIFELTLPRDPAAS